MNIGRRVLHDRRAARLYDRWWKVGWLIPCLSRISGTPTAPLRRMSTICASEDFELCYQLLWNNHPEIYRLLPCPISESLRRGVTKNDATQTTNRGRKTESVEICGLSEILGSRVEGKRVPLGVGLILRQRLSPVLMSLPAPNGT